MMKRAFEEGKKVRFTKGKLLIDGKAALHRFQNHKYFPAIIYIIFVE